MTISATSSRATPQDPGHDPDPQPTAGAESTAEAGSRAAGRAAAAIDTPAPGVRVLRAAGALDREHSARLLRLVDTQLMLARSGHLQLRTLIMDLSGVHRIDREGPAALTHARYACRRRGVAFALAGMPGALYDSPVAVRARLRRLPVFPTVGLAVDALANTDRASEPRVAPAARRVPTGPAPDRADPYGSHTDAAAAAPSPP